MSRATTLAIAIALAACQPPPAAPQAPAPTEPAAAVDAAPAVDAPPPDAGPSAAVSAAPAWIFRYRAAGRDETWTLRHAGGEALLVVETAQGTTRYLGTATDGASLALDVRTVSARMQLDCKRARRPLGPACNDGKAPPVDILDCYHPDFAAPMPFGAAPGIEYVVDATCNGYRLAAP